MARLWPILVHHGIALQQSFLAENHSKQLTRDVGSARDQMPNALTTFFSKSYTWDPYAVLDEWAVTTAKSIKASREGYSPSSDNQLCEQGVSFFTKDHCDIFISDDRCTLERSRVTLLASHPGSGNTWIRLLIDQLTGIYTGSAFYDDSLADVGMEGEGHMDPSDVIAVKVHFPSQLHKIPFEAPRAIVLLRQPLESVLSQLSLLLARKQDESHKHDKEIDYDTLRDALDSKRDELLDGWKRNTEFWLGLSGDSSYQGVRLIVRLEDFIADQKSILVGQILPFLGVDEAKVQDRVDCALDASIPETKRTHTYEFEFTSADEEAMRKIIGQHILEAAGYA